MNNIAAIVLAGGKGTRMKSDLPKVLQKIAGRSIILWTLDLLKDLCIKEVVVVTGYKAGDVENEIKTHGFDVKFAQQDSARGTAHAVDVGLRKVPDATKTILVLYGDDSGLYNPQTIQSFIEHHLAERHPMTILTVTKPGYEYLGGLARDGAGNIVGVSENSHETVCGAFCFDRAWLKANLKKVQKSKVSGEYGLPQLIKIAAEQGKLADNFELADPREWTSVNTPDELKYANRLKEELTQNGSK